MNMVRKEFNLMLVNATIWLTFSQQADHDSK